MTEYLALDDALHVATRMGFHIRDAGLLASAVARPATTVFGEDAYPTMPGKAAALLESASRNHPFVDGNKRSGWTLLVSFLWLNGYVHEMDADTAFSLIVGVAGGHIALEESTDRIAAHIRRRQQASDSPAQPTEGDPQRS